MAQTKNDQNALINHPKVQEAKKLIQEALQDIQSKMPSDLKSQDKIDTADADRYRETLEKLSQNRGGKLFYDYLGSGLGKGPLVQLADGSYKYDFITGIGVHYFGHAHPGVIDAMVDGALANTTMQGHLQQNVDSDSLIDLILKEANRYGAGLDHCFLTSSGVMACENALKIAFQKKAPMGRVLAFDKCFHGRTMAVAQITDKAVYRSGLPHTLNVDYIPFYDHTDPEGSLDKTLAKLREHLNRYPCQHAVMMMEVIQGEAGAFPGTKEFFHGLIKVLKEHGVAIIVDEVQSFARTEKLFAFQYFELDNLVDIVTIGKNSQVCATLFRNDYKPRPGLISQTFTSSSASIRAGKYIIDQIVNQGFLGKNGKINQLHNHFKTHLQGLEKKYPEKISGPYGIGGMVGMTLFKGDAEKSRKFTFDLFERGVLSFTAGGNPTRVRFLLPVGALENHHIDQVVEIIESLLKES